MKKILVVDDERDLVETIKNGLEYYGFSVDGYTDPQKTLSEYQCGAYDLLLTDINIPKINGFQLYREILKKDHNVKVCFMTASDEYYGEFRMRFPDLDRTNFIRKPFGLSDLTKILCPILA